MHAVGIEPSHSAVCEPICLRINEGPLDPRRTWDFIAAAADSSGAAIT